MGCKRLILLTAFLLFTKNYEASTQYQVVECLQQPTATITRPILQSGQFILPAIIQPVVPGLDSYPPEPAPPPPDYPKYGNFPAPFPGYPPIIIKENNDKWRNLFYLLMLTLGTKKQEYPSPPPCCGCPCCSAGKCKCCCSCSSCSKNVTKESETTSSAPIYIPIPFAVPIFTPSDDYRYLDYDYDDIIIQESSGQPCNCNCCNGKEVNELNLIIKTDE